MKKVFMSVAIVAMMVCAASCKCSSETSKEVVCEETIECCDETQACCKEEKCCKCEECKCENCEEGKECNKCCEKPAEKPAE